MSKKSNSKQKILLVNYWTHSKILDKCLQCLQCKENICNLLNNSIKTTMTPTIFTTTSHSSKITGTTLTLIKIRQVLNSNLKFSIHLIQSLVNIVTRKSLIDEVRRLVRPTEYIHLTEAVNITEEFATQSSITLYTKEDTNSDPIYFIIYYWIYIKLLYTLSLLKWNPLCTFLVWVKFFRHGFGK
jgi:hypothetical protein